MIRPFFRMSLFLLLLLGATDLLAQSSNDDDYSRKDFIEDFRNGVLLVRLQDKHLTLKQLEERGMTKEAEQVSASQRRENREVILSFSKTFDFCPVYFFYAQNSESIRNRDLSGKVFDSEFQMVEIPENSKVFTAEFAETPELGIDGLIITDEQMLAFEDPLPYFERRYVLFGLIERSKARMAQLYNKKLHKYNEMYSE